MESLTLTIDGLEVNVPEGTTVLEACRYYNIPIPTLCHARDVAPGACRLCVVQIEGLRNLPPSCVTEVKQGMVVQTNNAKVRAARKTILELLIANHPLDCMTCEKLGACDLAKYAYEYGATGELYQGEKRCQPIDDSNPYILRDPNKCILCGKCIATCNEVADRRVIDYAYRGFYTKVAPFLDTDLKDSNCVYCNRCVSVCPVGALIDKNMLGQGRSWEITKQRITCTFCEAGCQFDINSKNGNVVGVTARAAANGRPLCLKGRIGTDFKYTAKRTERPFLKKDGEFVQVSWEEFLGLGNIVEKINGLAAAAENQKD